MVNRVAVDWLTTVSESTGGDGFSLKQQTPAAECTAAGVTRAISLFHVAALHGADRVFGVYF